MSLFTLQSLLLCQRGISKGKLKIYTINGLTDCAKNECNTMVTSQTRYIHHSRGANRPSDVAARVHKNVEFNLIVVNCVFQCFSWNLIRMYCHALESSVVNTVPPCLVESLPGRSNRSLLSLLLILHAEGIIHAFSTSNIQIEL
jgi:hypothetical protein